MNKRTQIFTNIYLNRMWKSEESASGNGSDFDETAAIRGGLLPLICDLKISTLLDAPCGDFNWMRLLNLPIKKYIGVDIVSQLIASNARLYGSPEREFVVGDIVQDPLPQMDMILCRDCLNHLPLNDGAKAIQNFNDSGARYLAATTYPEHGANGEMALALPPAGWRPLNLEFPPFSLGVPFLVIAESERVAYGKMLGVWELSR